MLAFFTILVFCLCVIEAAPVSLLQKSRQFIPPLPGYIPVYIRLGNTPLEEINLDLADAFRNYAVKQARLNNFRSLSENCYKLTMILKITVPFLCVILSAYSQENAANSVSTLLQECYNNTETLNREVRLPSSINVLIALLRKIESGPYRQNDRELAIELIHRFRQDGIMKVPSNSNSPYVIPFSPLGIQADKNKILLRKLIPGTAENFPTSTLSLIERCSIHFMISNSFDFQVRGDESSVCNALGRFQRRVRRKARYNDDIEIFEPVNSKFRKGNLEEVEERDPNKDVDVDIQKPDLTKKNFNVDFSQCPLENGAVYTRWGAVQAGSVIAGIASGREPQIIQEDKYNVDSRFAVTLAGDLSEVNLHQGTKGEKTFVVGAKGGWNGTQVPRWYFVERSANLEMTDAEIRGSLDGLIFAKNMETWKNKARSIKISQVLDMYYSTRGVFSKKYRACNRLSIYYEVAPQDQLVEQTIGFSFLLDKEAKLFGTIEPQGIQTNGKLAVDQLNNYISSLQDLRCEVDSDTTERTNVDLLIVLDTDSDYNVVQRALAHLLDNVDVNPYESNYTIINAKTGEIMVNSSNTIIDFYTIYNKTLHTNTPRGIDITQALNAVEQMFKTKIDNEVNDKTVRGKSTIVLLIPYNVLSTTDKTTANTKKELLKKYLPDLKLLVLGRNAKDAYSDVVFDAANDAFDLTTSVDGTSITQSVNPVIDRIKQIHRRIINPKCGSSLHYEGEPVVETFDQFLEPNSVVYYRVSPNYLFGDAEKVFKFQGYGYGNIVVCSSRQIQRPNQNSTTGDVKCESISGNNLVTFSFNNPCKDYDTISSCPPLYFSVTSTVAGEESTNIRCTESGCRFPDSIFYQLEADGISSSVPKHLLPCYKKSYRNELLKPPLNLQLLIELIRKFELREKDALNIRMFTTSLLHSVRYDGIMVTPGIAETDILIPVRAVGQQFYKYKLLVEYMISGRPQLTLDGYDSIKELCLLHEILSNTVEVRTRENKIHFPESENTSCQSKKCYVEGGVITTKWGVISPSHIIAGVAAALQEISIDMQEVVAIIQEKEKEFSEAQNYSEYTGRIDNIWIATIAGDLGEVVVQQAFNNPQFGKPGIWDNAMLPRLYYLEDEHHDMTSAEFLGAIDGAIFASQVKDWLSILSLTRLSQLLDMYYSTRGIAYDTSYRACERRSNFHNLAKNNNWTEQTFQAANLLIEVGATSKVYTSSLLDYSNVVTERFNEEADLRTMEFTDCNKKSYSVQPLEIMAMFDESWTDYDTQIFVGTFAEAINLGMYGSAMGIINYNSGTLLTNVTDSIVQLYDDIGQAKNKWQTPLRLSKGLEAVINYLQRRTWTTCKAISRIPRATILLVLSNKAILGEDDMHLSKEILYAIKETYPETFVIYVTSPNNADSYLELVKGYVNDAVIKTSDRQHLIPQIMEKLIKIPNRIIDFYCNNSKTTVEDYVTPGETNIYEIHSEYLRRVDFIVKFKGYDYGEASICVYDSKTPYNKECKGVGGTDEVNFIPRNYCSDKYSCKVQFSVTATKSNFKCAEFDCRFPDQVRIEITTTWTKRSGSTTIRYSIHGVVVVLLGICLSFHEY
ncbi:hypothetical protein RN001_016396 [Aquatica leii]|uniref:Uncharacterized protein n=1 Tax=Aquatica leii TaxID=1421715 RepID=A0AAN7PP55_9COLE|nr:hypothetical protein RN001_016396 [Aquatica leii]